MYPKKVCPGSSRLVGMRLSDFQALVAYTTTKSFIHVLPNPNPTCRLTAKQAVSYTWLASIAALTEHDLCGMRKNLDLRSRWRAAIGTAHACCGLRKSINTNNNTRDRVAPALTMKTITQAGAGRHCDARHQNQTPRDNSICCHHRQKIVRLRVDWWDSWRRGPPDNQQCRLRCRFLMPSTTPRLLPRLKHTRLSERGYTPSTHNINRAKTLQNQGGRGRSPTAYARVIQLWGSRQCCAT